MVTYPSTHGVFETRIGEICDLVHTVRRAGVPRRRQPQRAGRRGQAGRVRRRRQPPQPAQDVLHPPRRRRPRRRPGGGPGAPRPLPARTIPLDDECGPATGPGPVSAAPYGSAGHPAHLVGVRPDDGRRGAHRRPPSTPSSTPTTSPPGWRQHFPVLYAGEHGRVAHECIIDVRDITTPHRRHGRRRRQATHRLRLPRPDDVVPGGRHADDRAHRVRVAAPRSTGSATP